MYNIRWKFQAVYWKNRTCTSVYVATLTPILRTLISHTYIYLKKGRQCLTELIKRCFLKENTCEHTMFISFIQSLHVNNSPPLRAPSSPSSPSASPPHLHDLHHQESSSSAKAMGDEWMEGIVHVNRWGEIRRKFVAPNAHFRSATENSNELFCFAVVNTIRKQSIFIPGRFTISHINWDFFLAGKAWTF